MIKNHKSFKDIFSKNTRLLRGDNSDYGITLDAMHIINTFNFEDHKTYIDFGCGDGRLTLKIKKLRPKIKIIGIDLSEDLIEIAKKNNTYNDLDFYCAEINKLSSIKVDGIFSFSVLQFIDYRNLEKLHLSMCDLKLNKEKFKIIHYSVPDYNKRSITKTLNLLDNGNYVYATFYFILKFFDFRKIYNDHGSIFIQKKIFSKIMKEKFKFFFTPSNNIQRFDVEIRLS